MSKKWNASYMFPTDSNFVNRITDVTFGPSSNGNPMITMVCEVVSPTEVEIGEDTVTIAGVVTKNYFTTTSAKGEAETKEKQDKLLKMLENLGLDVSVVDWDNLGPMLQPLKGKLILTMMEAEEDERTANPTAAELAAGKAKGLKPNQIKGRVLKNPITGQALVNYWPKIREIFGLAPSQDGVKVPY